MAMNMKRPFAIAFAAHLLLLVSGCRTTPMHGDDTVVLKLQVSPAETKRVSVTLGQNPREVIDHCKPAEFYCDDDPWLSYSAAGGGKYVLFFSPGSNGDKPDPNTDTLSAVALYAVVRKPGSFLLPAHRHGQECPWEYLIGKGSPDEPAEGDVQ